MKLVGLYFLLTVFVSLSEACLADDRFVTNLNDSGEGSLRGAVSTDGPAKVIFKVAGDIILKEPLEVKGGHISIDGSTAPGMGIRLIGYGLNVTGSDFDIKHLRIWVGDLYNQPHNSPKQDGVVIQGTNKKPVRNGQISNCTIFAAVDEGISTHGPVSNVLFYRNMILWGLNKSHHQDVVSSKETNTDKIHHSMAILANQGAKRVRFIQNLLLLNRHRNPRIMPGASVGFVNNVVYGWGPSVDDGLYFAEKKGVEEAVKIAFTNNYYQAGDQSYLPANNNSVKNTLGSIFRVDNAKKYSVLDSGNLVYSKKNMPQPSNTGAHNIRSDGWLKSGEKDFNDLLPEKTLSAKDAYKAVLKNSGASPQRRDTLEKLAIQSVKEKSGTYINSPRELDVGYPNLQ